MPFDFLVKLRSPYLLAWIVCGAAFGHLVSERPATVDRAPQLLVVSFAFAVIASLSLLAPRIESWRRFVLRDSATLDETKPGLLLLATLGYGFSLYGAVYAFDLWSRN